MDKHIGQLMYGTLGGSNLVCIRVGIARSFVAEPQDMIGAPKRLIFVIVRLISFVLMNWRLCGFCLLQGDNHIGSFAHTWRLRTQNDGRRSLSDCGRRLGLCDNLLLCLLLLCRLRGFGRGVVVAGFDNIPNQNHVVRAVVWIFVGHCCL